MNRVWVVHHRDGYDLTDASRFGEVKILLTGKVNVFRVLDRPEEIWELLKDAKPEDYLLLSGYSVLNVIATNVFMQMFGSVKLLVWDGIRREYVHRTLSQAQMKTTGGNRG